MRDGLIAATVARRPAPEVDAWFESQKNHPSVEAARLEYLVLREIPDRRAACDWFMGRATQEDCAERLSDAVSLYAEGDLNAAGKWLEKFPPGPQTDKAYAAFACRAVYEDGYSAWQWALRITDPGERHEILSLLAPRWSATSPTTALEFLKSKEIKEEHRCLFTIRPAP